MDETLKLALDGVTSFSEKPLRISGFLGFIITIISFLLMIYGIVSKFIDPQTPIGWTSVMITISFFGGVQLLFLGIIGQYLGRIYNETKERPLYVINKKYGFDTLEDEKEQKEISPYLVSVINKEKIPTVSVAYLLNRFQLMMQERGTTFLELSNPNIYLANELDRLMAELFQQYELMSKEDEK